MSSDFTGSWGEDSARLGYGPRLSSQRFDSARFQSSSDFADSEWLREGGSEEELPPHSGGYMAPPSPEEIISESSDLSGDDRILPPPAEGDFALTDWRRQNAIRLEEKEKKEKEMLKAIMEEADEYKAEFYRKWKIRCDNNRAVNREKEKLFLEGRDKFHAEAMRSCWKAISELIPREIAVIEKKGKKDKEKKPSIVVIQGPKPGKPTDVSLMRQILVKLKHKPPTHMMPPSYDLHQGVSAFDE